MKRKLVNVCDRIIGIKFKKVQIIILHLMLSDEASFTHA